MSRICVRDILASTDITETTFANNNVDDIMCHAVTLMTSKLLKIYAFNRFLPKGGLDAAGSFGRKRTLSMTLSIPLFGVMA